jgi:uncharacterized protein DUF3300
MKASLARSLVGALALLVSLPLSLYGQTPAPPAPAAPLFSEVQLDQLLASIALYPDQLVAQILMAATYPLEVVEAARWVQDPNNARLKGDALAAALQDMDWDPSVKSLVPFPQLLQMMNSRLNWMQKVGDAFLAQQSGVMDSIQRLRREAENAGRLKSSPQQVVGTEDQAIVIEPANPDEVNLPYYDPTVVYGPWPYPDYPPYTFSPPPGFDYGAPYFPGFWWGPAIEIVVFRPFWGWGSCDWRQRSVHVDHNRYDRIPGSRPPLRGDTWQHDPHHRRGVAYRDPGTAVRFGRPVASPNASRAFRGFETGQTFTTGRPTFTTSQPRFTTSQPNFTTGRPATAQPGVRPPSSAQRPVTQRPSALSSPSAQQPMVQRPSARSTVQRPAAPAFGGYHRGADARAESARGRASLQSTPPRAPAPSAGGARSPGGGGGGGRPSGGGRSSGGGGAHR